MTICAWQYFYMHIKSRVIYDIQNKCANAVFTKTFTSNVNTFDSRHIYFNVLQHIYAWLSG